MAFETLEGPVFNLKRPDFASYASLLFLADNNLSETLFEAGFQIIIKNY